MAVEHMTDGPSLIDVLDRVLDKGIVIDTFARVSLVGIDMITIDSHVTVASFDTHLRYSEPLRHMPNVAGPWGVTDDGSWALTGTPDPEKGKPPPERPAARAARIRK